MAKKLPITALGEALTSAYAVLQRIADAREYHAATHLSYAALGLLDGVFELVPSLRWRGDAYEKLAALYRFAHRTEIPDLVQQLHPLLSQAAALWKRAATARLLPDPVKRRQVGLLTEASVSICLAISDALAFEQTLPPYIY